MDDDGKLIRRYLSGEATAFDELVQRHQGPLFGYLLRMTGIREEAEDLAQDAFVRVLGNLGRYRHRDRFRAWLMSIARNLVFDRSRRAAGMKTVSADAPAAAPGSDVESTETLGDRLPGPAHRQPEAVAERRERAAVAQKAIAALPEVQREVFLLRQAGLTFREIAKAQKCPLNTALGRMHDAVMTLRGRLEEKA